MNDATFHSVFTDALRGEPCTVVGLHDEPGVVPVGRWDTDADHDDLAILDHCRGPVLDIGCGPGRMTSALLERGFLALGIDVVREAVDLTIRRGGAALQRDVFEELPAEGRWGSVLLADGNVGIGGDPVALLRRAHALLGRGGLTVVEVAPPGVLTRAVWATLEAGGSRSRPFRWAVVGVDGISEIAAVSGHRAVDVVRHGERWCAVLETVAVDREATLAPELAAALDPAPADELDAALGGAA